MDRKKRVLSTRSRIFVLLLLVCLPVASSSLHYWFLSTKVSVKSLIFSPNLPLPSEKVVCIVFDDGWLSQLNALSVLEKYEFKATFGIVTSYVDRGFEAYLSWDQILHLHSLGHDIESHSMSHVYMNNQSLSNLLLEVAGSHDALIEHKITSKIFIYPFGEGATNKTVRDVIATQYLCARNAHPKSVDLTSVDPYSVPAFGIFNSTSFDTFKLYVNSSHGEIATILYYHKIGDPATDRYTISLEQFDQQMVYLKDNDYTVKTMRELFLKSI